MLEPAALRRRTDRRIGHAATEEQRLAYLAAYRVLDTAREDAFDRLVRMARAAFTAPIALLSFIDSERQWFKSEVGLAVTQVPREAGFCNVTIQQDVPLLVPDASRDLRFADAPVVSGTPHVRAYAGVPLIVAPGMRIGTIGICDLRPREFSAAEIEMLVDLSHVAVDELSLRRAQSEAENARHQLHSAIEALPDGFMLFDEADRLVVFNRRVTELYPHEADVFRVGTTFEELIRRTVALGWYPDALGSEEAWIERALAYHHDPVGVVEQPVANGGWLRISETKTEAGATVGFRVDITKLKRRESELFEIATRDALTGVLTRRSILDDLERELVRAERYGHACSILVIDADHFKQVNDKCGHQVGDGVLRSLAESISASIREVDRVGRLGGEEFMVVLADTDLRGAMLTAARVRQAIEAITVAAARGRTGAGDEVRVTASIGVAQARPSESTDEFYARADNCLYAAKAAGRNRVECECGAEPWVPALDAAS